MEKKKLEEKQIEMLNQALETLKQEPHFWHKGWYCSDYEQKFCILGQVLRQQGFDVIKFHELNFQPDYYRETLKSLSFNSRQVDDIININDDAKDLADLEQKLIDNGYL